MSTLTTATPAPTPSAAYPYRVWPIMSGLLLVLLLASLDQTVVGTAMPRVIAQLNGFNHYAWVGTSYLLASTLTVPIYGKLSDLVGRKVIFLLGVVVFLCGSALCGAAQTMGQLVIFRGFQGLGTGALVPVAAAIVGDLFSPRERAKPQGLAGAVWGFAALLGPTLGGWISDNLSWRWIFYLNLPLGLLALAVLVVTLPPLRGQGRATRIDVAGPSLLAAGVLPLLLAFSWAGTTYEWLSPQVVGLFAAALFVLGVFVRQEARHAEPILDPALFKSRIFAICVATNALIGAGLFGTAYFVPLFVQGVIGATATGSGAILTPLLIAAIVGTVVSGQLLGWTGRYRYVAMAGVLCTMAGMAGLLRLDAHAHAVDALPALALIGLGLGLGLTLYTIVVQNVFPNSRLGEVSAAVAFFRSMGGAIGIAMMGSVLTARYTALLEAQLPSGAHAHLSRATWDLLHNPQLLLQSEEPTRGGVLMHPVLGARLDTRVLADVRLALAGALHQVFLAGFLIGVAAFVLVLFLPETPLRGREPAAITPVPDAEALIP